MVRRLNNFKTIALFILLVIIYEVSYAQNSSSILPGGVQTIVIDAGHGGKDPGCHGAIANEKEVVLAIALKLGEYIKKKYPEMKVIFTRDDDTFVELNRRAEIAIENHADVFISIHANSAGSSAYGTETYVLGLHRTESQEKVAARENSTILFEENSEEKYENFNLTPDAIIARQLQLSFYLNHSISLASKVQAQFKSIGRRDRGVKQAGFLVLYKTTMPSILIESGFLTNPKEEKFLASPANQLKMANSIFKAFQEYVAEINGVNAMVVDGHDFKESLEKLNNTTNNESTEVQDKDNTVYFKVQVATSKEKIALDDPFFKGHTVNEYQQNGLYKYTIGQFENNLNMANEYKTELRKNGFENAFVVGFYNGERIPIAKAIELSK